MVSINLLTVLIFWLTRPEQAFSYNLKQRSESISTLVKDLIKNEEVSSMLWVKTCWPKTDDFKLTQIISIPIQIVKSHNLVNISVTDNTNKQWFLVDMSCGNSSHFLSNIDEHYFAHPFRWIIVDATNDSIRNLLFLPDSNVILANQEETSGKYILKQGIFE